jgi:hypothetical protein
VQLLAGLDTLLAARTLERHSTELLGTLVVPEQHRGPLRNLLMSGSWYIVHWSLPRTRLRLSLQGMSARRGTSRGTSEQQMRLALQTT